MKNKLLFVLSFATFAAFAANHSGETETDAAESAQTRVRAASKSSTQASAQFFASIASIEDKGSACRFRLKFPLDYYKMSQVNPLDNDEVAQNGVWVMKSAGKLNCGLRVGQQISGILNKGADGRIELER